MGRHALEDRSPRGPVAELLGWGVFATALATGLAGWVGDGWHSALPVAGLGCGATGVLWAAARLAHLAPRRPRPMPPAPRRGEEISPDDVARRAGEPPAREAPPAPAGPTLAIRDDDGDTSRTMEPGGVLPGA